MSFHDTVQRRLTILLLVPLLMIGSVTTAAAFSRDIIKPSTLFLQAGTAGSETQTYAAGATWDWGWHRHSAFGVLSGYSEMSFGRWITDVGGGGSAWETQVGITPVVRLRSGADDGWTRNWFAEIGVGANVILPIYRSKEKRFSTTFNFGDHLAIGREFGARHQHELAVRVQHFSNGGIDEPNPGENFVQLRYSRRW
jgi:lipid A 3-O-deacylase